MSPEVSSSEYLRKLLAMYQATEQVYMQAVSDVITAEIRREEALRAKNDAMKRLEEARMRLRHSNVDKAATVAVAAAATTSAGRATAFENENSSTASPVRHQGRKVVNKKVNNTQLQAERKRQENDGITQKKQQYVDGPKGEKQQQYVDAPKQQQSGTNNHQRRESNSHILNPSKTPTLNPSRTTPKIFTKNTIQRRSLTSINAPPLASASSETSKSLIELKIPLTPMLSPTVKKPKIFTKNTVQRRSLSKKDMIKPELSQRQA